MTEPKPDIAGEQTAALRKKEFCQRFKAQILTCGFTHFPDGTSVSDYVDQTAPYYFD